jgi:signal peptidase
MKVLFNTIHYVLIAAVMALAFLLLGTLVPIPGNFKVKIVKSGSMEPTIKTGSIVIDKPENSYQVGDIVTFGADTKTQIPTTHRIVGVAPGPNPIYTTKGDANDAPDQADTHLGDIHGKVIFTVPYVGYVLDFARKPLGFALLVGVPAGLIILEELGKIVREVQRMRRKKSLTHATQPPITYRPRRIVD